jgi:prepilin-type N-terminal cleavage/methylation domain-containing protein
MRLNPTADLPRSPRAARRHQRGFTIIEALIAVAILSAALGVIFGVHTNAMLAAQLTSDRAQARLHLESLLAETAAGPAAHRETAGAFDDRFSWRISVAPFPAQVGAAPAEVSAVSVTASVAWRSRGADRALSLTTVRLQGAPP